MKNKWIKRLIILIVAIVLSIGVQTGLLFFVRNYYISSDLAMEVEDVTKTTADQKQMQVTIPENADYMIPSNNGRYILYVLGEEAHVVNFEDGTDIVLQQKEKDDDGNEILVPMKVNGDNTFFCWHDTEEKLIISQTNENGYAGLRMYYYNPRIGAVQRALDLDNKPRTYSVSNSNQRVTEIRINNANTILYLTLSTEYRSDIYRLDISGSLDKMTLKSNNIGEYRILKNADSIVYEELNNDKLYVSDKNISKEIIIDGINKPKLLDLKNNILYVGDVDENGLIKAIYSKDVQTGYDATKEWNVKELDTPVEEDKIDISRTGNVYINDDLEGEVEDLNTSNKTKYEGKFIGVFKDKVISEHGNTIYRKGVK